MYLQYSRPAVAAERGARFDEQLYLAEAQSTSAQPPERDLPLRIGTVRQKNQCAEHQRWIKNLARYSRLIPGPADLVFVIVLGTLLDRRPLRPAQRSRERPGTCGSAARSSPPERCRDFDTLTFTREHAAWVDQSWAFDVLLAAGGRLTGVVGGDRPGGARTGRALCRNGAGPDPRRHLAGGRRGRCPRSRTPIGSIHFLIRPHLFTFAFVYLTLPGLPEATQGGGWAVAPVPLYTAILANLHGGFVALPVIVATAGVGPRDLGRVGRRATAQPGQVWAGRAGVSGLAALANPYGFGLYRHVGHLLFSSGVTSLIVEYQPAPFGKPEAEVLEWVLLAFVGLPVVSARRIDRYQLAHVLVWLHLALTSIRNAPLFALAAAPALATLIDGLPLAIADIVETRRPPVDLAGARRRSACSCWS